MNTEVKNKRILIVDDEPDILEFLSYNFLRKGFDVSIAKDGAEGIESAIRATPDVIISDIMMPVMDGVKMCEFIRKDEKLKFIPLIFLTAVTDDYKILHAASVGANDLVSKPVKFDLLLMMVDELLEKRKAG